MEALEGAGALASEAFPKIALAGNASVAVKALDSLKKQGKIGDKK